MSDKQRRVYNRRRNEEYMYEMDKFMPDSLDEYDDYYDEENEKGEKKQKIEVFGRNIFNNKSLSLNQT